MTDISQIVAALALQADEQAEWPPARLRVRTYLTTTLPPLDLVSSVRAPIRQGDQILVVRDLVSVHILHGGRCELGETLVQTLEREVLEETGWTIRDAHLIGLAHFQHCKTKARQSGQFRSYVQPVADLCCTWQDRIFDISHRTSQCYRATAESCIESAVVCRHAACLSFSVVRPI